MSLLQKFGVPWNFAARWLVLQIGGGAASTGEWVTARNTGAPSRQVTEEAVRLASGATCEGVVTPTDVPTDQLWGQVLMSLVEAQVQMDLVPPLSTNRRQTAESIAKDIAPYVGS